MQNLKNNTKELICKRKESQMLKTNLWLLGGKEDKLGDWDQPI